MATYNPTTAEAGERDRMLGQLYGDLETSIGRARDAMDVLAIVAEATIETRDQTAQEIWDRACPGMKGFTVHLFTDQQVNALAHAWRNARDLVNDLHSDYHAGLER